MWNPDWLRWMVSVSFFLGAALIVATPARVSAQHGHPPLPSQRSLHQRLFSADVVVWGRVEAVQASRIRAHVEEILGGTIAEDFEIKRSPSKPLPLVEGDHALFLLRGARSPYVMAEDKREVLVLDEKGATHPRIAGVRVLLSARDDPPRWARHYIEWLEGDDPELAQLGLRSLLDPQAPFIPLPPDIVMERVEATLDPDRSEFTRRASAAVVATSPEGSRALLERLLGTPGEPEPMWVSLALRGALVAEDVADLSLLVRTLRHRAPAMRRAGIGAARLLATPSAQIVTELERVAGEDPEEELRREAARTLRAIDQRRASEPTDRE